MRVRASLTVLIVLVGAAMHAQRAPQATPVFIFYSDELWLNLHHFLYVLGRYEAGTPDRTRRAVASAPVDAEKGLARLTVDEQRAWHEAVRLYAEGPSRRDAVFDESAIATTAALVRAGAAQGLAVEGLDPVVRATLERVAPLYQKVWWSAHQAANRGWVDEVERDLRRYAAGVLQFITRAYGLEWPSGGYPVHVSAYANWAGAYSTGENILVISSLAPADAPLDRLESVFHEAMHQWDAQVDDMLRAHARAQRTRLPGQLSHALVFYTAGEAVRSVSSTHIPYAERGDIWKRSLGVFKADLDAVWKPHLEGKGTRDDAFAELIRRAAARRAQ